MPAPIIFALAALFFCTSNVYAVDYDRDGLADDFEQELLHRFVPTFMVAVEDCDVMPSEFLSGSREPRPVAKNGTIYGQVFPSGPYIEIHYYHLWSRDCGRRGHSLDVEYVSALIRAERMEQPASEWKAAYWYASAHQDTVCDVRNGARASQLQAEEHGPMVWISQGKHASYLSYDLCNRGCGADRCDRVDALTPAKLVNIGERGAPLNGAVWAESRVWALTPKMKTDFDASTLAVLDDPAIDGPTSLRDSPKVMHAVIAAGGTSVDALATGNRHTNAAVSTAGTHTDRALDTGLGAVGRSLSRARRAVAGFLGLK
jgi:hypothetical protein